MKLWLGWGSRVLMRFAREADPSFSTPCFHPNDEDLSSGTPVEKTRGAPCAQDDNAVGCCLLERAHVDDEAVLHILLEHALEGFIDLLDRDDFDVSGDVVPAAVLEHLLGFGHAA